MHRRAADVVVVGGGPAGLHAALEAKKLGRSVVLVDEEPDVGGACVRRGTIPSKTLRETAVALAKLSTKTGGIVDLALPKDVALASLSSRTSEVVAAHERIWGRHLREAGVDVVHGRAHFDGDLGPHVLVIDTVRRDRVVVEAAAIVLATGSRPRTPADVPVDHEVVLDSDSILSLPWLPARLVVLGGGVIATEYASIFASLGVQVTMVDRAPRPLGFLDEELVSVFLRSFERAGGRFLGGRATGGFLRTFDGVDVTLDDGTVLHADKVLCALGRVANVAALRPDVIGLATDARGLIVVDERFRTAVPHVFAVGDVVGPPSLASTAMEQGRRAARHACGAGARAMAQESVPVGVYAIPEIAAVGLSEHEARERGIDVLVGRASFADTARGVIAANEEGVLKLVVSADGRRILGVHVVGEGAAELVHLGQLAMRGGLSPDVFVDQAFNFPTLAEAYRVAALDVAARRRTEHVVVDDDVAAFAHPV